MENSFADLIPKKKEVPENSFADLIPSKQNENSFADLIPQKSVANAPEAKTGWEGYEGELYNFPPEAVKEITTPATMQDVKEKGWLGSGAPIKSAGALVKGSMEFPIEVLGAQGNALKQIEIAKGLVNFVARPTGLKDIYNSLVNDGKLIPDKFNEFKEAWVTDPVGSAVAVLPLLKMGKGLAAGKPKKTTITEKPIEEAVKEAPKEYIAGKVPVEELPDSLKTVERRKALAKREEFLNLTPEEKIASDSLPEGFEIQKVPTGLVNLMGDEGFRSTTLELKMPDGRTAAGELQGLVDIANSFNENVFKKPAKTQGNIASTETPKEPFKQVLSEGKPIPPEVLKDYPELQGQLETVTTGAPQSTEGGFVKLPESSGLQKTWDGIRGFFDITSTLPEGVEFKKLRNNTLGKADRIEKLIGKVWERTKKLPTENKRDIFWFMDGTKQLSELPKEIRPLAQTLQTQNNLIGKMFVKRGLMTQETFEAHKGAYIRYVYLKNILGDKPVGVGKNGLLDLSELKKRGDLTREEQRAIGLIEDVSIAQPIGMSKSLTDIAKFDMMDEISKNPNWTWKPSVVAVENKKMGIGKLAEEYDIQRKMAQQHPNVPEIQSRLKTLEDALNKAKDQTKNIPEDFVQLPNSPQYGNLAGSFVRKEIAMDIEPVLSWGEASRSKLISHAVQAVDKSMAAFKVGKTALNFPTIFRNTISNTIQLNMSGIPFYKIPIYLEKAAVSMIKKDAIYTQGLRNGLFKTNWGVAEIGEVLNAVKEMKGKPYPDVIGSLSKIAKYYGKIDDFSKLAKLIEQTEKGVPIKDAVIQAQKWGMDYSLAHPAIKKARRFIAPFVSYQYKIAPLIAETIKERPWVLAKYAAIPYVMQQIAQQTLNLTDDDWKKLKSKLPLFIKKNESMAVLPWKSPEGDAQWVNLEYYFPWQQFLATGRDVKQGNYGELAGDLGIGNPLMDVYTVMKTMKGDNPPKDPFTGRDIYNRLDSPTDKALKTAEWLYNKWSPSMLTREGALGTTFRATEGKKDKYGRTVTPEQATGKWLGFNIVAPTDKQAKIEKKSILKDLNASLFRIMKDPTISTEEKKEAQKTYILKKRELSKRKEQEK